jgi:hypothetical protein
MFRAAIAYFGVGYNLPQGAIYPSLANDSETPARRQQPLQSSDGRWPALVEADDGGR